MSQAVNTKTSINFAYERQESKWFDEKYANDVYRLSVMYRYK